MYQSSGNCRLHCVSNWRDSRPKVFNQLLLLQYTLTPTHPSQSFWIIMFNLILSFVEIVVQETDNSNDLTLYYTLPIRVQTSSDRYCSEISPIFVQFAFPSFYWDLDFSALVSSVLVFIEVVPLEKLLCRLNKSFFW